MRVWYHPLFNNAIDTINLRYIIPLNEDVVCCVLDVGCVVNLSYLGKIQPFKTITNHLRSKWQLYRTNIRISKSFPEFQKRQKRGYLNLSYLGKTTTLQNNYQPSSFQVATLSDEHSLLKKFSRVSKEAKERLQLFLNQPLIFRKNNNPSKQLPTIFVPSGKFIGRTFAFQKVFQSFKRGVKRGYLNLSYLGKTQPFEIILKRVRSKWQVYQTNIRF
jgi:hypothetical protein